VLLFVFAYNKFTTPGAVSLQLLLFFVG